MDSSARRRLRLGYGIFLSVLTVAVGVLFIVETALIYYGDPNGTPYTREVVGERLLWLLAPVIVWILAIVGGFVLSVLDPPEAPRPRTDGRFALRRLKKRIPNCGSEEFLAARQRACRWERARLLVWLGAGAVALAGAIACIVYLARPVHFAGDIVSAMPKLLANVLPWVGAAFAAALGATYAEAYFLRRETAEVKTLLVLGKGCPVPAPRTILSDRARFWILTGVRIAVGAVGIAFVIAGIVNGGMNDVLVKAVKICTECIGLG